MTTIFFSGTESESDFDVLQSVGVSNILVTFMHLRNKKRKNAGNPLQKRLANNPNLKIFVDSGVFTLKQNPDYLKQRGETARDYIDKYIAWLYENKDYIYCAVNYDMLTEEPENTQYADDLLKKFEQETGVPIIYVWHAEYGAVEWEYMCRVHKYIGVGSGDDKADGVNISAMLSMARRFGTQVHGFGITDTETLGNLPYFSVDSSVGAESLVWVRHGKHVEVLPIKELFDRFYVGKSKCITPNYETLTCDLVDGEYKTQWKSLQGVERHINKKPYCRVMLETGRSLEVTGDHSLFSMDSSGELVEVKPSNLKVGDYLTTIRAPVWGGKGVKHLDTSAGRIVLSTEFLEFIGLWIADGWYLKGECGGIGVSCADHPATLLRLEQVASLFNREVKPHKNGVDAFIHSTTLNRAMREIGLVGGSHNKNLPPWFWSLSKQQACALLRGYYSGDGSGGEHVECSTVSKILAAQVQEALPALLGCLVSMSIKNKKHYATTLCNKKAIESFCTYIGFLQPEINAGVICALNESSVARDEYLSRVPTALAYRDVVYPWKNKNSGGRVKVRSDRCDRKTCPQAFDRKTLSKDIVYLKIKKIEWLPEKEREVFDLCVPGPQRFVANGILAHNTTWVMGAKFGRTMAWTGTEFRQFDGDNKARRNQYRQHFISKGVKWDLIDMDTAGQRGPEIRAECVKMNAIAWMDYQAYVYQRMAPRAYWNQIQEKIKRVPDIDQLTIQEILAFYKELNFSSGAENNAEAMKDELAALFAFSGFDQPWIAQLSDEDVKAWATHYLGDEVLQETTDRDQLIGKLRLETVSLLVPPPQEAGKRRTLPEDFEPAKVRPQARTAKEVAVSEEEDIGVELPDPVIGLTDDDDENTKTPGNAQGESAGQTPNATDTTPVPLTVSTRYPAFVQAIEDETLRLRACLMVDVMKRVNEYALELKKASLLRKDKGTLKNAKQAWRSSVAEKEFLRKNLPAKIVKQIDAWVKENHGKVEVEEVKKLEVMEQPKNVLTTERAKEIGKLGGAPLGNKNALKTGFYSKKLPSLTCDACPIAGQCYMFRQGHVCAFDKEMKRLKVTTVDEAKEVMCSIVTHDLERLNRQLLFETVQGGVANTDTSKLIAEVFSRVDKAKNLMQEKDPTPNMNSPLSITETKTVSGPAAMLAQLFKSAQAAPIVKPDHDAERKAIDVTAVEE